MASESLYTEYWLPAVKDLFQTDNWLCKVCIPVSRSSPGTQKIPSVHMGKQDLSIYLGLFSTQRVYTKLICLVMAYIGSLLHSVIYLDDLLLMSHPRDHLITKMKETTARASGSLPRQISATSIPGGHIPVDS